MRLSKLFAMARGLNFRDGNQRCWFCGSSCDDSIPASDYVLPTCTTRQYAMAPSSNFVCVGCAEVHNREASVLVYGEDQPREKSRVCSYSWLLFEDRYIALTKAHIHVIREFLLSPPDCVWGLAIASSGQKNIVWRGQSNHDKSACVILLEEEEISFIPSDLQERLDLAISICAISGKPALKENPTQQIFSACLEKYGNIDAAEKWKKVWCQPLSRLAAFICPRKDDCITGGKSNG